MKCCKKLIALCLLCALSLPLTSCNKTSAPTTPSFSNIGSICQLSTLKCYYHNVAKYEHDGSFLGIGYKKLWFEYSGTVELGIDASEVKVSAPDENGIVQVYIPEAKIFNVNFDIDSISEPLTETGNFTEISTEEQVELFAKAQKEMEEQAAQNTTLLYQAHERAKKLIAGYIVNVGEEIGQTYTVQWLDQPIQ